MISRDLTNNKQTEEALRESEERFRTVFEFAPMGIAIANKDGMLLQTNQAFQEILGYTAEELQNLPFIELTHPDDQEEKIKLFQELLAGKRSHFSLEKRYFRKDGRIVWSNVSVSAVCDANGLVQYAFAMIQDISAQKQAELDLQKAHEQLEKRVAERTAELEQANTLLRQEIGDRQQAQEILQAQHQFLQTVLDTNPNMIVVKDREGRVVLANQAYADFRGTIVEDLLGKTDADFNPNQSEVEQFRREDQEIFTTLQPKFIPEETCRTKTGEVRWYQIIKKPIFSSDGQVYGVLAVCSDITERKLVEEALRESEQRYRLLIEGMNDGVIVVDENRSISYVNEKLWEMLGYFPSEMIGHPICEFVDETYLKIVQEQTTRRRRGESGSYELGLKRKDGQTLLTLASGTPILGTDGSLEASFGVISDITALKAVESELQQAKEQLQAVLNAVPGFVSWISSEGRYLGVNQHLAHSFNLSPDAFVGKELGFLKNSSEFVQFMKPFLATPAQTDRQVIETQINGSTRNYLIVAQKYNQGSMAVSVGIDITERKRAQEALKAQKEFLQTVLDTNPSLIWVKDTEDRIVLANQALADFFETTVEDLMGKTNPELHANPADAEVCIAQDKEVLNTLREKFIPEEVFPTPSRTVRWFQTIKKPIFSSEGQIRGVFGVSTDITERKLLTEELLAQKDFLQTVLDTNPNAIFVKDREGKFVLANQAFADIQRRTVEQVLGLTDVDLHPNQADTERFIVEDQEVITTLRQKFIPEQAYQTPSGEVRCYQTIKRPLFSSDGQVYGVLGVSADITERKRAQEALKTQKEFLQTILDTNPNMIYVKDREGRYVLVNQAFGDFYGITVDQALGLKDADFNPNQADRERYIAQDFEVFTTLGQKFIPEEACHTSTGEVRWLQTTKKRLVSSDGQVYQLLGVSTDITQHKLALEALHRSEARFRLAIDNIPNVFVIYDAQRRFQYVNAEGLRRSGKSFEEHVGYTDEEIWPNEVTHKYLPILKRAVETRTIQTGECNISLPNSATFTIVVTYVPVRDEEGKVYQILGITHDITARKEAEEVKRQTQARLRRLVEANLIGVIFADFSGNITEANDAFLEMVGYTREDLRSGKVRWDDMTPPEYDEDDAKARAQLSLTGVCTPHEKEYIRKDGSRVPILTGSALLESSDQDCVSFVIDLTWRKQAEARIRESLREKEVLLQEIHHRVKNNLQVISSLLDLQSQYIDERSTLEVFRESCNRVKSMALVHEKLYESKDCAKSNFAEYIESLISYLFQVYAGRAENIALELDIDEVPLNIDIAIPCGLIISELVSNALKYAFTNKTIGVIHVELHSEIENHLTLIVKDNGRGLPVNFDIKSVKTLGLQLVNILTNQLEGTIEINHRVGTEFKIKFPKISYQRN